MTTGASSSRRTRRAGRAKKSLFHRYASRSACVLHMLLTLLGQISERQTFFWLPCPLACLGVRLCAGGAGQRRRRLLPASAVLWQRQVGSSRTRHLFSYTLSFLTSSAPPTIMLLQGSVRGAAQQRRRAAGVPRAPQLQDRQGELAWVHAVVALTAVGRGPAHAGGYAVSICCCAPPVMPCPVPRCCRG